MICHYNSRKTFTRSLRATWESEGARDLSERAKERASRILKEYKPIPLPEAVVKEMRLISENAEREITEVTTV